MKKHIQTIEGVAEPRAILSYSSGWKLRIPKSGRGPMLLLEWMAQNRGYKIQVTDDHENGLLVISFDIILRGDATECRDYINSNL